MPFLSSLCAATAVLLSGALLATSALAADRRISGPHVHENLAVYLVHGTSVPGPVPLTLQEAITKDAASVIETGNVNQLEIENTGTEEVFVQAGDIVKGGKQDRVLTMSLVLPPKSGKMPIGAFCVEQERWAARGKESVARFASSDAALPSREAKLAMARPAPPTAAAGAAAGAGTAGLPTQQREDRTRTGPQAGAMANIPRQQAGGPSETSSRQSEIWDKVKKTQEKLSGNLGGSVAAAASRSSLQLSLESENLKKAQTAFVAALQAVGEKESDVVGMVVAINGKLSSADLYPSNGLFRKMWTKQLGASATEAIGEKDSELALLTPSLRADGTAAAAKATHTPPSREAVEAFLAAADDGKPTRKLVAGRMQLETRDGEKSLMVQAARTDGGFVHRNYLAK